ncbi:hypothetical protein T10_2015 [Trichinella papuae]|uniref:Uncharacterized protein n=1 Tax=Trichinella papuae TaxID=268474 RepID=A0A0V1MH17_9BILA|nr:hypothetical protein T10_2015 [Trichinella papuae]
MRRIAKSEPIYNVNKKNSVDCLSERFDHDKLLLKPLQRHFKEVQLNFQEKSNYDSILINWQDCSIRGRQIAVIFPLVRQNGDDKTQFKAGRFHQFDSIFYI